MFSPELESRLRGMFLSSKFGETLVKDHIHTQREAEAKGDPPMHSAMKDVRKRAIVREWPRDPNGPAMKSTPAGKTAGNGQPLWGATVLDFFRTRRFPELGSLSTITTGSKLLAWMKEIGELEHAKDEIKWAEDEADAKELLPCDMAMLLRDGDYCPPGVNKMMDEKHTLDNGRISAKRYFDFQNRLPLHLLPEKLIVHDPDDTLHVNSGKKRSQEERATPRVYKLMLTQETQDIIAAERAKAARDAVDVAKTGRLYATESEDMIAGKVDEDTVIEATFVALPPPPALALSTPEAHLYINAADILGQGNHSQVYRVTWEIPRSLVMEPYLCDLCVSDALLKKLKEEAPDAPIDEKHDVDRQIEDLMIYIASKHERRGKMTREYVRRPAKDVEIVDRMHGSRTLTVDEGGCFSRVSYEGNARRVEIDVEWTTSTHFCVHEKKRQGAPTTFKVSVGAKLSHQYDDHLAREARNYQEFPGHFFQHWSGYNIIPPLHDPTPALALVPQFYGYYEPEEGEKKDGQYLSPILLLENCGVPINVDDLDLDDRHECASLLFRMHCEGWLHNSFYPRNILMQHGDMTDWPVFRSAEDRRFRLIDFGRSEHYKPGDKTFGSNRAKEEYDCQKTFKIINCPP